MKTLETLRKEASSLGIRNYSKFSKEELMVLISSKQVVNVVIESEETLTEEEELIIVAAEKEYETTPNLPSLIYSNDILVVKEKKEKKVRRINYDIPDYGTQSRKVYDYIEEHLFDKNFTIYRVCQVLNTPSNNTRRIYLKFFAQKRDEFLLQSHLEVMESIAI